MSDEVVIILAFTLSLVLIAIVEALVLSRRQNYDWKDMGASFVNLAARNVVSILLPFSLAAPVLAWASTYRIHTFELNTFGAIALLFLGQEFAYYWYHRASHRVRWFWCHHGVHHSPNSLNFSAGLRIGIFGKAIGTFVFYAPLVWLGFPVEAVAATLGLNLLYQFWIHATWIPRLGWLEGIINTPSAHRVHHASNLPYLDANYGGVLLIFDRLFGTYVAERADLPCTYGLVHPLISHNPITIELHQWKSLLADLRRARSLKAVLGAFFMPPGWRADGPGETTEEMRARAAALDSSPTPPAIELEEGPLLPVLPKGSTF